MRNHRQRMRMQKLRVLDKEVPEDISFDQANFRVAKTHCRKRNGLNESDRLRSPIKEPGG